MLRVSLERLVEALRLTWRGEWGLVCARCDRSLGRGDRMAAVVRVDEWGRLVLMGFCEPHLAQEVVKSGEVGRFLLGSTNDNPVKSVQS